MKRGGEKEKREERGGRRGGDERGGEEGEQNRDSLFPAKELECETVSMAEKYYAELEL